MRTSELTGDALVCAVAMCEGYTNLHKIPGRWPHEPQWAMTPPRPEYGDMELWEIGSDCDWAFFGPIIEREEINLLKRDDNPWHGYAYRFGKHKKMRGQRGCEIFRATGPTPLIAAMRCFVFSRLGDEVDVPDELTVR